MSIYEVLSTLKANLSQTDITLYPGASEQLIQQFEQEINLVLPTDFKKFYSFCNGFESDEDMFRLIPLEEILERKHEFSPRQFYLAEYLIYGEIWEVEIDYAINRYQIFNIDFYKQRIILTDSLSLFIHRFLQGGIYAKGGLVDWQFEIRDKKPS